jgi:hypothetical protein
MHAKEKAIAPIFRNKLAMEIEVAPGINTDTLGTFTGEIPRAGTIQDAAIAKARLGMAATGLSIGIASEGSYGPHPSFPFIPAGIELMVVVDDELGIIVSEHLIDDAPVFNHILTADSGGAAGFLDQIGFPEHAVIVRPNEVEQAVCPIHKGLRTTEALTHAIADCSAHSRDGMALVQTDMRAHMNPTRMAALGRLAALLCDRLATPCPACGIPGYDQIDTEPGLPCEWCGSPSVSVRHLVFGCVTCEHREKRPRPDGRTQADPGHCPECNP